MRTSRFLPAVILILAAGSWSVSGARDNGRTAPASTRGIRAVEVAAAAGSGCGMLETVVARVPRCDARGAAKATAVRASAGRVSSHDGPSGAGCDACASWADCRSQLESSGASTQIVPLKNGVMYVYTADTPMGMRAVQAAVAQHHERLHSVEGGGDKVHLCASCRAMRGAAASGKLVHEVLNIDGGCIMVTTSSDPAIVSKIYAEAGVPIPPRVRG
jgi:hypothetical protein